MIQKISAPGAGFRGALNYLLDTKKEPEIVLANMAGENPRTLAREFGHVREMNERVSKPVFHASLSAGPADQLSDQQWREVVQSYVEKTSYADSPWVAIRHRDKEHDHVHIIASRIRFDGTRVADFQERKRGEAIVRDLERTHGLQQVAPSREATRSTPDREELGAFERTGRVSVKARLQEHIDLAARDRPTMGVFVERLEAQGVHIRANVASTGRVSGISFELAGVAFKGSDLGRAYSWQGLQGSRGIGFDEVRDLPALRAASARAGQAVGQPAAGVQGAGDRGAMPKLEDPVPTYRSAATLTSRIEISERLQALENERYETAGTLHAARSALTERARDESFLAARESAARNWMSGIYRDPQQASLRLDVQLTQEGYGRTAALLEQDPGRFGNLRGVAFAGYDSESRRQALRAASMMGSELRHIEGFRAQLARMPTSAAAQETVTQGLERSERTWRALQYLPRLEKLQQQIVRSMEAMGMDVAKGILTTAAAKVAHKALAAVRGALLGQEREKERGMDLGR
jgi:relaxase-like protein